VALIQWAHERGLENVVVLHSRTGWATAGWNRRLEQEVRPIVARYGYTWSETTGPGMPAVVIKNHGWPAHGMQFCTKELKIAPTMKWYAEHPETEDAVVLVGIRRCESVKRSLFPEWTEHSLDGGRPLWAPLVNHTDAMRNALIVRAGIPPLFHRSRECCPCVNSNRKDLKICPEEDVKKVELLEAELHEKFGLCKGGGRRVLFRPKKHRGAVGIRQILAWARGTFDPTDDTDTPDDCGSGACDL
jgi:hypothetical protein